MDLLTNDQGIQFNDSRFHIYTGEFKLGEYSNHKSHITAKICVSMERNVFIQDDEGAWGDCALLAQCQIMMTCINQSTNGDHVCHYG